MNGLEVITAVLHTLQHHLQRDDLADKDNLFLQAEYNMIVKTAEQHYYPMTRYKTWLFEQNYYRAMRRGEIT